MRSYRNNEWAVSEAINQLFELQSMAEIGCWVSLQIEEMEDDNPVAKKLQCSMGYYIRAMGRLTDPALEILDDVETELRSKRKQS